MELVVLVSAGAHSTTLSACDCSPPAFDVAVHPLLVVKACISNTVKQWHIETILPKTGLVTAGHLAYI